MKSFFDKVLTVKVDKDQSIVNLSVKVTETVVGVYKISLNDFIQMIADFNSQLSGEDK